MSTTLDELTAIIPTLSPDDQRRLLSFARALANPPTFPHTPPPPGSSPDVLLRIRVDEETGKAMEEAHEESERIWPDPDPIWPDE